MLNKILYKIKTRNYFHPEKSTEMNEEDFMKILRGEVFNPRSKQLDSERYADYAYMVVGVSKDSPLNCWAGREFGSNGYWNAHEQSIWYGKFCCEHPSRIIIPGEIEINFNPNCKLSFGRSSLELFNGKPWYGGGFMQADKDIFTRTLVSDLSASKVIQCFKSVYG